MLNTLKRFDRSPQWIVFLVASMYLVTMFLRSILTYRDSPELLPTLGIMLVWAGLFFSESIVSRRWAGYFPFYMIFQTGLVFVLLATPGYPDFFTSLLSILGMQIMLRLDMKIWVAWIGLCALATGVLLADTYENEIYALVLLYTAGHILYGFYARATRQAEAANAQNMSLAGELQAANQQLQAYAAQVEQLVVARERNRLARDLHDSVTQTVFSMTLTIQAAALLLKRDPGKVEAQLERLNQLAHNALSEMQLLIAELKPEAAPAGLVAALKSYLAGGHLPENLSVALEVEGDQRLEAAEEQALFHIIQEALNNIAKHAQAATAQVRLHLVEPLWIEVEDQGRGFDLQKGRNSGQVGLASMRERAAEIGWELHIKTSPGSGTCVRVEKSFGK
jgi:signal transduction histidine kinase